VSRKVRTIVCIGGNGTMKGAKALAKRLKARHAKTTDAKSASNAQETKDAKTGVAQVFFVPVTIDSDVQVSVSFQCPNSTLRSLIFPKY
jgi:6-phosphofructokinase